MRRIVAAPAPVGLRGVSGGVDGGGSSLRRAANKARARDVAGVVKVAVVRRREEQKKKWQLQRQVLVPEPVPELERVAL